MGLISSDGVTVVMSPAQICETSDPPSRIRPALTVLLEAVDYAEQTNADRWDFAIELDRLTGLGLTLNDFRWLVRKELVEHQREVTRETEHGRAFRPSGDLSFPERSCFVLTTKGIFYARQRCKDALGSASGQAVGIDSTNGNGAAIRTKHVSASHATLVSVPMRPEWDPARRLLRINGTSVKQFKWMAENQEAILCAFEEEGWPWRIDDPLPPHADQDSKRRLSDTIKCLNRKQDNPMIHFRGDGTGEGIIWEFVNGCHARNGNP